MPHLGIGTSYWTEKAPQMTTFNTPWVNSYHFDQSGRRCLPRETCQSTQGIPKVHNMADDVLVDGKTEVPYDISIIALLETARGNNIPFNCENFSSSPKISRSLVETWPQRDTRFTQEGASHHRNKATKESSMSSELSGTSQLPHLL